MTYVETTTLSQSVVGGTTVKSTEYHSMPIEGTVYLSYIATADLTFSVTNTNGSNSRNYNGDVDLQVLSPHTGEVIKSVSIQSVTQTVAAGATESVTIPGTSLNYGAFVSENHTVRLKLSHSSEFDAIDWEVDQTLELDYEQFGRA